MLIIIINLLTINYVTKGRLRIKFIMGYSVDNNRLYKHLLTKNEESPNKFKESDEAFITQKSGLSNRNLLFDVFNLL